MTRLGDLQDSEYPPNPGMIMEVAVAESELVRSLRTAVVRGDSTRPLDCEVRPGRLALVVGIWARVPRSRKCGLNIKVPRSRNWGASGAYIWEPRTVNQRLSN